MASTLIPIEKRGETIADNLSQLIGYTPMVYLSEKINTTKAKIALKLESENPMASVKDRLALSIIIEAEKEGKLVPGKSTIIECTSGNTGVGLAFLAAARGYRCIIVMPETMSIERRVLIATFGAELILTPAATALKGAMAKAKQLLAEIPDSFDAAQFFTTANEKIHYETTGPEIWKQTQGKVAAFIAGIGTGGTVTGAGRFLKEQNPEVKVYGFEPAESAVINGEKPAPHKIQGTGAGFIPEVFARGKQYVDGVVKVSSDEAIAFARELPKVGLFGGLSSGAAVKAALEIASKEENEGKLIVAIIPSFGERYLSTILFAETKAACEKWKVEPVEEIQALLAAQAAPAPQQ